eukprot:CAMPEP_0119409962 /NCGR_PEP_ID=MMETSP1335-20130426/3112_1 /TAXON_ID=259385 /ORGANISM="Chrysoculter rhomboideus, Strain RCC1486" /LENGTH=223 /DNA_ID=CAMNT_0007434421 /DNA_START=162 /DNA_END=833 /DNA_ORIENTATION=-
MVYQLALAGAHQVLLRHISGGLVNRLLSSVNALIIFSTAGVALAGSPSPSDAPPIDPLPASSIECMLGFLVFDTVLGLVQGFESSPRLMLAHHLMGLLSEGLTLYLGVGAYCTMVVHLAEGSTPLLHMSWLLLKRGQQKSTAFLAAGLLLVISFFILRVAIPAILLWGYMSTPVAFVLWGDHTGVYRLHLAVVTGFWLLNLFWFTKLLKATAHGGDKSSPRVS